MSQINAIANRFRANGCLVVEDLTGMIVVTTKSGRIQLISTDDNAPSPALVVKYLDQAERIARGEA